MSDKLVKKVQKLLQGLVARQGPDVSRLWSSQTDERSVDAVIKSAIELMGPTQPKAQRLKFIPDLVAVLKTYRITDVTSVWDAVSDFLRETRAEDRGVGWTIMEAIIEGQYQHLKMLRVEFFQVVERQPGDEEARARVLSLLTKHGRDVSMLEHDVGRLLLQWLDEWQEARQDMNVIVGFLMNLIKYNHILIESGQLVKMINQVCALCNTVTDVALIGTCLNFLDVVVRYARVPRECLLPYTSALCRTVNHESLASQSWQVMKNILRSSSGHQTIFALCAFMDDGSSRGMVHLLRGAVFFTGMASWGSQRVLTVGVSFSAILPSIKRAVYCLGNDDLIIAYEVALSMSRLVKKYGAQLVVEWDIILEILAKLQPFVKLSQTTALLPRVQDTLTELEVLFTSDTYQGNRTALLDLLTLYKDLLPDTAINVLMEHRSRSFHPTDADWLVNLNRFMSTFFAPDNPISHRRKALSILSEVFARYRSVLEDELLDQAVIPCLTGIHTDTSQEIQELSLQLLVQIAEKTSSRYFEQLVAIIQSAATLGGLVAASSGLVNIFAEKMERPPPEHTIRVFTMLLSILDLEPEWQPNAAAIKSGVLTCLVQVRATPSYNIVWVDHESKFLTCNQRHAEQGGLAYLPVERLVNTLQRMLTEEKDDRLFETAARGLKSLLQNKYILTSVSVSSLCRQMYGLMAERAFSIQVTRLTSQRRAYLVDLGYQLLVLMLGYKNNGLDEQHREAIVHALVIGVAIDADDVPRTCLSGLSLCMSELTQSVRNYIRHVINVLTRGNFSAFVGPVVEFIYDLWRYPSIVSALRREDVVGLFRLLLEVDASPTLSLSIRHLVHRSISLWFLKEPRTERVKLLPLLTAKLLPQPTPPSPVPPRTPTMRPATNTPPVPGKTDSLRAVTLELVTRYAYSDHQPYPPTEADSEHAALFGESAPVMSWVQGSTILTVRCGKWRWAEFTVRRSTGTVRWLTRLENEPIEASNDEMPFRSPKRQRPPVTMARAGTATALVVKTLRTAQESISAATVLARAEAGRMLAVEHARAQRARAASIALKAEEESPGIKAEEESPAPDQVPVQHRSPTHENAAAMSPPEKGPSGAPSRPMVHFADSEQTFTASEQTEASEALTHLLVVPKKEEAYDWSKLDDESCGSSPRAEFDQSGARMQGSMQTMSTVSSTGESAPAGMVAAAAAMRARLKNGDKVLDASDSTGMSTPLENSFTGPPGLGFTSTMDSSFPAAPPGLEATFTSPPLDDSSGLKPLGIIDKHMIIPSPAPLRTQSRDGEESSSQDASSGLITAAVATAIKLPNVRVVGLSAGEALSPLPTDRSQVDFPLTAVRDKEEPWRTASQPHSAATSDGEDAEGPRRPTTAAMRCRGTQPAGRRDVEGMGRSSSSEEVPALMGAAFSNPGVAAPSVGRSFVRDAFRSARAAGESVRTLRDSGVDLSRVVSPANSMEFLRAHIPKVHSAPRALNTMDQEQRDDGQDVAASGPRDASWRAASSYCASVADMAYSPASHLSGRVTGATSPVARVLAADIAAARAAPGRPTVEVQQKTSRMGLWSKPATGTADSPLTARPTRRRARSLQPRPRRPRVDVRRPVKPAIAPSVSPSSRAASRVAQLQSLRRPNTLDSSPVSSRREAFSLASPTHSQPVTARGELASGSGSAEGRVGASNLTTAVRGAWSPCSSDSPDGKSERVDTMTRFISTKHASSAESPGETSPMSADADTNAARRRRYPNLRMLSSEGGMVGSAPQTRSKADPAVAGGLSSVYNYLPPLLSYDGDEDAKCSPAFIVTSLPKKLAISPPLISSRLSSLPTPPPETPAPPAPRASQGLGVDLPIMQGPAESPHVGAIAILEPSPTATATSSVNFPGPSPSPSSTVSSALTPAERVAQHLSPSPSAPRSPVVEGSHPFARVPIPVAHAATHPSAIATAAVGSSALSNLTTPSTPALLTPLAGGEPVSVISSSSASSGAAATPSSATSHAIDVVLATPETPSPAHPQLPRVSTVGGHPRDPKSLAAPPGSSAPSAELPLQRRSPTTPEKRVSTLTRAMSPTQGGLLAPPTTRTTRSLTFAGMGTGTGADAAHTPAAAMPPATTTASTMAAQGVPLKEMQATSRRSAPDLPSVVAAKNAAKQAADLAPLDTSAPVTVLPAAPPSPARPGYLALGTVNSPGPPPALGGFTPVGGDVVRPVAMSASGEVVTKPADNLADEDKELLDALETETRMPRSLSVPSFQTLLGRTSPGFELPLPPELAHYGLRSPSPLPDGSLHQETDAALVLDPMLLFATLHPTPGPAPVPPARPIALQSSEALDRALMMLDLTPTVDTHKVGLIYVAPGQYREREILANTTGSPRYLQLLESLGSFFRLKGFGRYAGGLDREDDTDGEYGVYWRDELTWLTFHVTTMMPNRDATFQNKKLHIGNDFVNIVYSDSKENFSYDTIPGQFNFVHIIIRPLEESYSVTVKIKPGMEGFELHTWGDIIVSQEALPVVVRQLAIRADLMSLIHQYGAKYVSNWEERMNQIERVGARCAARDMVGAFEEEASTRDDHKEYEFVDVFGAKGKGKNSAM